jgi:hypothetical protein
LPSGHVAPRGRTGWTVLGNRLYYCLLARETGNESSFSQLDTGGRSTEESQSSHFLRLPRPCADRQAAAVLPNSVMNSRRFSRSNCIVVTASLGRIAGYRFRGGQSAGTPAVVQPDSRCIAHARFATGLGRVKT